MLKKPAFVIVTIWLVVTAVNIDKAFQLDDGFHLQAAANILDHPLTPMSGSVRWDLPEPTPIHYANQPPLFFFMIAGVTKIFGFREVPLHILVAFFSLFTLIAFYKLVSLTNASHRLISLALLGFCPALVVNQNVFTDVPLLCMILWGLYFFLLADKRNKQRNNLIAISLFTIGLFIKYTMLPVLATITFLYFIRKQYKNLGLLLIPVSILLLWSIWNYLEYGGVHILSRKI